MIRIIILLIKATTAMPLSSKKWDKFWADKFLSKVFLIAN